MRTHRLQVSICAAAVILALAPRAFADPSALDQAKLQFNAGAQAYSAGRYGAAVSAFEDAYRTAPRPQILFSLAQAERKRYFAEGRNPDTLRSAIAHYEQYVKEVKSGARVVDAVDALTELGPMASKLDPNAAPVTSATPAQNVARLTIYSPVDGAKVTIDNGAEVDAPFIGEVTPGKHTVKVRAEGFSEVTREVLGEAGVRNTVDVPLEEKPAELVIGTDRSCDVYLDGRPIGVAPSVRPLFVPAGPHVLSFIANGRRIDSKDVVLERGKRQVVSPVFERSGQRTFSVGVAAVGGATFVIGVGAALVSITQENKAKKIRDENGNISAQDLSDYDSATRQRDGWETASIVTLSAGGAMLIAGALLYGFDKPDLAGVPPPREKTPSPKKPDVDLASMPLVTPMVTRDGAGLSIVGRF